ncbi:MAG: hypothetical protein KDB37_14960 [Ilumatobacter sp.]|nr:hypothetical protein [Ilumatobacter sp.]
MNDLYFEGTLDDELVRVHFLPTGRLSIRRQADGEELWSGDPLRIRCSVSGHRDEGRFVYFATIDGHTIVLQPGDTAQARNVVRQAQGSAPDRGGGTGVTTTSHRVPNEVAGLERIAGVISVVAYLVGISGVCIGMWLAFQSEEVGSTFRSEREYPYVAPGLGIAVAAIVQAIFIVFAATWAKAWAAVQRLAR